MTIDEMLNVKSVFDLPFYQRGYKHCSTDLSAVCRVTAWHCPRVEVLNYVNDPAFCSVVDNSSFDVGTDKGEGVAWYNPQRVSMQFISGDVSNPNTIIFRMKED